MDTSGNVGVMRDPYRAGPSLSEFLLARIAEDEEQGTAGEHWDLSNWSAADDVPVQFWDYGETHIGYRRFLAECEAKRRIVDSATDVVPAGDLAAGFDSASFNAGSAWREHNVLRALAQPYADHADFREEWRLPDTRT